MDNKRIITYEEYGFLLNELTEILSKEAMVTTIIEYVYGFSRGGLPIAIHLSHHLDLKFIDDINYNTDKTLFVDDIADTGKTLKNYEYNVTATLFLKRRSVVTPMFYIEVTDKWIVFPWEKLDEIPNR